MMMQALDRRGDGSSRMVMAQAVGHGLANMKDPAASSTQMSAVGTDKVPHERPH